jgi:cytochrome c biogenesis protein CcdA
MKKSIFIFLFIIVAFVSAFLFLKGIDISVLPGDSMFLPVLVASSLIDSINPCALSVLLISIAFLASLGISRGRMIALGASYVFGIFAVYFLIGLGLLRVLDVFGIPNFMGKIGALILFIFGLLNVLSYVFPNFPIEFKIPKLIHGKMAILIGKASFVGCFLLGALVALFEFPCTGGPYLMILGLLHDGSEYLKGLMYLFVYNLIFVSPLVLLLIAGSNPALTSKVEGLKKSAAGAGKAWGGVAMIILAIVIFLVS